MAVNRVRAVLLTNKDDVAAMLVAVEPPTPVAVTLSVSGEKVLEVSALQPIPFGHKIAIRDIAAGEKINRYGFPIGVATTDIKQGGHVHVHNMRSLLSPAPAVSVKPRPLRSAKWLTHVVSDTLRAAGAHAEAAEVMAESITEAHLRGVETHGLRRLRPYAARIRAGGVDGMAEPEITGRSAVLMVDGRNGVGHYIAAVAAQTVSAAAKKFGVAIALVRNSNHFGFAGYFATMIAAHGQIGIVTSNGQVCVGPKGATRPLFSNNPLAIAAPTGRSDAFLELDLATSATSRANIVEAARSGALLPEGWAQDSHGAPTRDPDAALTGSLLAFGGDKGFGLLVALEAITGVLAGGAFADQVANKEISKSAPEGTGFALIAIDLDQAIGTETYAQRLDDMLERLHRLPTGEKGVPPRYPGERRWLLRRDRLVQGIPLVPSELADLLALARELGVSAK